MKQIHIFIHGDVQGVGYRSWMKQKAQELHLTGWVKNREDSAVEAIIQGNDEHVMQMVSLCKKGPDVAWVEKVEIIEGLPDLHLVSFEVLY
jgi:acylphosphatase